MFKKSFSAVFVAFLFLTLVFSASGQRKKRKTIPKKTASVQAETAAKVVETPNPEKKNSRPAQEEIENSETLEDTRSEPGKKNGKRGISPAAAPAKQTQPIYFYEFSRPDFNVSNIYIEHDENGKGEIRFLKKHFDEEITDPVQLSPAALERVKRLWQNLNFLDSTENYQYEKDYSHLGNIKFTMKSGGRTRTAAFNWTTHPDAKALADEYRKIGNQYIWIFDINVSRENQPLESPKIMNALDSQIRRDEIADPAQMIPFLKQLSDDERMPLISRNHATRIIREIEKKLAKSSKQ